MIEGGGVVHGEWWNRSTKGGLTCTVFISLAGRPDSPKDPPAALNELPGKPAACTRPKQRRTFAPWLVSPREVLVRLQRGGGWNHRSWQESGRGPGTRTGAVGGRSVARPTRGPNGAGEGGWERDGSPRSLTRESQPEHEGRALAVTCQSLSESFWQWK